MPSPPPPPPPAPLTGLPVSSEDVLDRPVLAVKIDNHTAARPHVGLDRADVIYEEQVEGGITRFIALFHSRDASRVGPIRSARVNDISVLRDWGRPLLAYSGAARYVRDQLRTARLVRVPHATDWWRDRGRPAPHNLFAGTKILWRAARGTTATAPEALFSFGEVAAPPPGKAATASPGPDATGSPAVTPEPAWPRARTLRIPFAGSNWTAAWSYHAKTGLYRRSHGSAPHKLANGSRVTARNILVLHFKTRPPGPRAPHPQPEIIFEGSGKATLLRDGIRIDGRWSRANGRTTFTDGQGRPFVFAAGATWVELVPRGVPTRYA